MDFQQISGAIKQILKNKKYTYVDLADYLELSESGVKKLLSANDISLNRISEIASFLEVPLDELMGFKNSFGVYEINLTSEQESLFLRDLNSFHVYWLLVVERLDKNQVLKKLQLKKLEWEKILLRLDKYQLLEVYENYSYKLPPSTLFRWNGNSKFVEKLIKKWSSRLLGMSLENMDCDDYYHQLSTLVLYPETYRSFKQKFRELVDEMARQSERERLAYPRGQLESSSLMVCMAPQSLVSKSEL